jgi:hypothetical protein
MVVLWRLHGFTKGILGRHGVVLTWVAAKSCAPSPPRAPACDPQGWFRARPHCRFAPPLTHFRPKSPTHSVPRFSEATMRPNPKPEIHRAGP